jgi:hypothetical protein
MHVFIFLLIRKDNNRDYTTIFTTTWNCVMFFICAFNLQFEMDLVKSSPKYVLIISLFLYKLSLFFLFLLRLL